MSRRGSCLCADHRRLQDREPLEDGKKSPIGSKKMNKKTTPWPPLIRGNPPHHPHRDRPDPHGVFDFAQKLMPLRRTQDAAGAGALAGRKEIPPTHGFPLKDCGNDSLADCRGGVIPEIFNRGSRGGVAGFLYYEISASANFLLKVQFLEGQEK